MSYNNVLYKCTSRDTDQDLSEMNRKHYCYLLLV